MNLASLKQLAERLYPGLYLELADHHLPPDAKAFEISRIVLQPERRARGIGTKIMTWLCEVADIHGMAILLNPDASLGATSQERLIEFYKRFGFVMNQGPLPGMMIRESGNNE